MKGAWLESFAFACLLTLYVAITALSVFGFGGIALGVAAERTLGTSDGGRLPVQI